MIAQTLLLACATLALASGACLDVPVSRPCVSVPTVDNCNVPIISNKVFNTGSISAPILSGSVAPCGVNAPLFADRVFPSTVVSAAGPFCNNVGPRVAVANQIVGDNILTNSPFVSGQVLGDNVLTQAPVVSGNVFSGVQATNGPETAPLPVIQAPAVALPPVESPMVALSNPPIPAPKVLSQRCVCTKTIVRPQVYQRQVTVPKIQRYLKRTVTPVVENVAYKSTPITQPQGALAVGTELLGASSNIVSAPVVSTGFSTGLVGATPVVGVSSPAFASGIGSCVEPTNIVAAPSPVVVSSGCAPRLC